MTINNINPKNLKTDLEKIKDSRKALEIEAFNNQIKGRQAESLQVKII